MGKQTFSQPNCMPVPFAQAASTTSHRPVRPVGSRSKVCKMAAKKLSIEDQVRAHINEKYLGSKDIEVTDSIDFCEYFDEKPTATSRRI